MYSTNSRSNRKSLWMPLAALLSLTLSACSGMPPRVCPPDQLSTLPDQRLLEATLAACQLSDESWIARTGETREQTLQRQALAIQACHAQDKDTLATAELRHAELVAWLRARYTKLSH